MDNLKHFICIRFLSGDYDIIQDDTYQAMCFHILETHALSSLNNSKNNNFEVLIIVNSSFVDKLAAYLKLRLVNYPINIIEYDDHYVNLHQYINTHSNCNTIITSNLDYDDFIRFDVIDKIHTYASTVKEFSMYGLTFGATVTSNDSSGYLFRADWFLDTGFMSIMNTLIYNKKYLNNSMFPHSIYDFNIKYGIDHTFTKTCIEKKNINDGG